MSKKKFYAIRNLCDEGYITSDYMVFDDIMKKSKGKCLIGKGFVTEEEAKSFLVETKYCAYTDCSYDYTTRKCSYGFKIYNNKNKLECSYNDLDIDNTGLTNVYGELKAVIKAVEMAIQIGEKIEIYYDFNGVEEFLSIAKNRPNRKHNTFIASYIAFMNEKYGYYILKNVNKYRFMRRNHNKVHNMVRKRLTEEIGI